MADTLYTGEQVPLIFDFTPVFSGIGAKAATLPGDSIASITSQCTTPSDRTFVSSSVIGSSMKASVIWTGGNTGESAGFSQDYAHEVKILSVNGVPLIGKAIVPVETSCL